VTDAVVAVGVSEQIKRLGIAALGQDLKALAESVSKQLEGR
jgi:hypothetical protein